MPIVSSTFTQDTHTQQGGGRYVVERHTDDAGQVFEVGPWLAPAGFDVQARVTSRASEINAQLAEAEAQALMHDGA
jgi:hypothetical protein